MRNIYIVINHKDTCAPVVVVAPTSKQALLFCIDTMGPHYEQAYVREAAALLNCRVVMDAGNTRARALQAEEIE